MSSPYYSANSLEEGGLKNSEGNFTADPHNVSPSSGWVKGGSDQQKKCNDVLFALLFCAHLAILAIVSGIYVPRMYEDMIDYATDDDKRALQGIFLEEGPSFQETELLIFQSNHELHHSNHTISNEKADKTMIRKFLGTLNFRSLQEAGYDEYNNQVSSVSDIDLHEIIFVISVTSFSGFLLAAMALPFMIYFSEGLIKFGILFNIIICLLLGVAGFSAGISLIGWIGFAGFFLALWYGRLAWNRIPFAAVNLVTAITAVRKNFGLTFFAYSTIVSLFAWTIWWSLVSISSVYANSQCYGLECQKPVNGFLVFSLLISFFWVHQVIKNIVHVTVAGTVSKWWFSPSEASSCCSIGIFHSFIRSMTYSFGSICLGSLVVAIIQTLKEGLSLTKDSDDVEQGSSLFCCVECISSFIETVAEYFNQWAFVFVAIYGYSFTDAGYNVINLFKSRGWNTIITDNLVENVLTMVSITVGVFTGSIGVILAKVYGLNFGNIGPFAIGCVSGFVITSVLMGVVASAVNTVIVCYAEAPMEFEKNHPQLSSRMRFSWSHAFPDEFQY